MFFVDSFMKRFKLATIFMVVLGSLYSIHSLERHLERRKIDKIPGQISLLEQRRQEAADYFEDGFLTPQEGGSLYNLCRWEMHNIGLDDSIHLTTKGAMSLRRELDEVTVHLCNLRGQEVSVSAEYNGREYPATIRGADVTGSDIPSRLDNLIGNYINYLNSDTHRACVGPLGLKQRFQRNVAAFAVD